MSTACYKVSANLIAATSLHIGSGKRTGVIKRGLQYVPGSFIRGAVGAGMVKLVCKLKKPLTQHDICEYFEECAYTNLYGEGFGKSSKIFFRYAYPIHLCDGGIYLPATKTTFICENPQCEKVYDAIALPTKCELCGGPLKPAKGFICSTCHKQTEIPVSMTRIALTAVD